ncbi:MAG: hypothetical protein ACRDMZ_19805, partial [Solirubrobacteraceae bacterium]
MSHLARRRLSIIATTVAVLVAPAAASAATYTVKPGDGVCGGGDLQCGGLAEAATAVNAGAGGDTITVAAGAYPGATFNVGGLTITGVPGVVATSTISFTAGAVSKLTRVAVLQTGAADAVRVTGGLGLELSDALVVSQNGSGVLLSSGTNNKIIRSAITSGTGTAISISAAAGVPVSLLSESTLAAGGSTGISAVTL